MVKFSVRHSVARAYGLLIGRPFTVIGLTWLPAVFYAVGASYLIQHMNSAMAVAVPSASGLFGQYAFFYFVALLVATAFFGALIAVPLAREAFGLREERVAAHLVVGAREFRMFFALLRYYAVTVTALIVLAIGGGVAISQGTPYAAAHGLPLIWQGQPLETWLNSAAGALATIVFLSLASRYGFFIDAIAAVEDHARLGRARSLAKGNFWSIAVTWTLIAVPATIVLVACEMTFGGVSLAGVAPAGAAAFAGILTVGLVVLHTLSAGASAGAYAEMAESVAHENEPLEASAYEAPAMALAQAPAETAGNAAQAFEAASFGAVAQAATMEIATPEADTAQSSWMPPPPDAHFGSDPHDALAHAAQAAEPAVGDMSATEPAAEAVADAEGLSAHPGEEPLPVEHEAQAASAEGQTGEFETGPVPDHAQNAEFPAPPLDPTGVIAGAMQAQASQTQSGFHTPG